MADQARCGLAQPGKLWRDAARQALLGRRGAVCPGEVRRGSADRARRGWSGQYRAWFGRAIKAWLGKTR